MSRNSTNDLKETEESLDSFFTIKVKKKPSSKKLNQDERLNSDSNLTCNPNTNKLLESIPKRRKEEKIKLNNQNKKLTYSPSTSAYSSSPSISNTNMTYHSTSPPPLPPPLQLPQIRSNQKLSQILVPDSSDSPQISPKHSAYLQTDHNYIDCLSDLDVVHAADPLPKLLFYPSSSPSAFIDSHPSKSFGSQSDRSVKKQVEIGSMSSGQSTIQRTVFKDGEEGEEEKRQSLLLDLGFDQETTTDLNDSVAPLSSSPIEIIQNAQSHQPEITKIEKEKNPRITPYRAVEKSQSNLNLNDQSNRHSIQFKSNDINNASTSKSATIRNNLLSTPQDQMKNVGVIFDDSDEDEREGRNSGIAPLMNSWPASKRTIFMRMAGLKTKEPDDEVQSNENRTKEIKEWDQLLDKHKLKNTKKDDENIFSTGSCSNFNKKSIKIKKTWNNRKFFRFKKKKSSSTLTSSSKNFKAFPNSSRFTKKKT